MDESPCSRNLKGLPSFSHRLVVCGTLLLSLLFTGCEKKKVETPDLIVLQTGRLRGNIYPLSLQEIAPLQYYPLLAGYIRAVREEAAENGAEVLLIDLGDSLDGSFASLATNSGNVVRFFNSLGYDAILLGNLDNAISPAVLDGVQALKLSPFLGADGAPAMPGAPVAAVIPPDDKRSTPVYLVSNFYGDTDPEKNPERFPSAFGTWEEGVIPDRNPVAALEALGERPPGALTLFAWMKFENPEAAPEEFLSTLRQAGVDAIVAHRVYGSAELDSWAEKGGVDWKPPVSQNILRQNGGFSIARMDLKREGNDWRVLNQQIIPMIANNAAPDQEVITTEEAFAPQIQEADRRIGELPAPWENRDILQSVLAALSTVPSADVVLYSPQSIRTDLQAGPLTSSRLFGALPWNTPIVTFEIPAALLPKLVARNRGWAWWKKEQASSLPADETLTIATSRFFATILRRQTGLVPSPGIVEVAPSEFAFYQDFLGLQDLSSPPQMPDGWSILNGEKK